MKIKICGLTQVQNAKDSAYTGIDAIGLIFYQKSSRNVDVETAQQIIQNLPPFINRVGLFVNSNYKFIDKVLNSVALDTLQFHGNEKPKECKMYQMPFIKAIAMNNDIDLKQAADKYHYACGLLLDTPSVNFGGVGRSFDWNLITQIDKEIILAGGLNADNIADAVSKVKPYGVDVSSGVESSKGIKDILKIKQFIKNATI